MTRSKIASELRTAMIEARQFSSPVVAFAYLERAVEWALHDLAGDVLPPTSQIQPTGWKR